MDTWHPLERAQYPEYFARRDQRKREFIERWEKKYGKPAAESAHWLEMIAYKTVDRTVFLLEINGHETIYTTGVNMYDDMWKLGAILISQYFHNCTKHGSHAAQHLPYNIINFMFFQECFILQFITSAKLNFKLFLMYFKNMFIFTI